MSGFHFLRPAWLLLLLPLVPLAVWLARRALHSRGWSSVCDPGLLDHLLQGREGDPRRRLLPWLVGVTGTLLILALAGPAWQRLPQPVFRDTSALVIALDLSRSMDAGDLAPSRLARARLKVIDLLKARGAGQTALLVFAADAFTVTPLTDDTDTILAQLPALDTGLMPSQGSRADRALDKAVDLLRQAGATAGHVLLITDGSADAGAMAQSLDRLRAAGHRLSVLGVGTAGGAPVPLGDGGFLKDAAGAIVVPKLDAAQLRHWAQQGGGHYAGLRSDDRDVQYLLGNARPPAGVGEAAAGLHTDQWREQGPWLILLAVPLALLAFRRGLWVLALVVLIPLPPPAQAFEWQDLWQRPDQRAMERLQAGDAEAAAQGFEDPDWKAAAQYRAGQYGEAAATLDGIETPDALYNRGNAQARAGHYEDAMASYEQALELDPQHEDARHNLELLREAAQQDGQQQEQQQDSQSPSSPRQDQGSPSGEGQDNKSPRQQEGQQGQQDTPASDESSRGERAQPRPSERGEEQEKPSTGSASRQEGEAEQGKESPEPPPDEDTSAAMDRNDTAGDREQREAGERWLRRIPDDPGGLLRRKFLYQYQQRDTRQDNEEQPW